jgi:hypothetical protein
MTALDALADDPTLSAELAELEREFPRGMAFAESNGKVIRMLANILQDRFRDLGISLRLRVEPPLDVPGHHHTHPPKLPRRIIVKSNFGSQRVDLSVNEQFVLCGEERLICTARDGAVSRVAGSLIAAIKKKVSPAAD